MLNNHKEKYRTFCISDDTARMQYEELANSNNVKIIEETRHWEGGSCYVALKYRETSRIKSDDIDLEKNNEIPTNKNHNEHLQKLKELSDN